MNMHISRTIRTFALAALLSLPGLGNAASYAPARLTHVAVNADGTVFIKWSGSPNPGPCGTNFGWVKIPASASDSIRALAFSIYFSGTPARVDTTGCDGGYEAVTSLYSPGG